ncbi:MAG: YitT family protein [Butyrivibrio sp.]|nr:YitT family protein [Butyrivibrio sp.]
MNSFVEKNFELLRKIEAFFFIILGALLASFSVACILLPNDAIDYGTAGIAIIISKLTGANLSMCVFLVFLPFLIMGLVFLGKEFFIRAVVGSVFYIIGLEIFEEIPFELNTEHFIAVAFGGAILGAGLSLILRFGGCIDGSEIFANLVINKISAKTGKNRSMTSILIAFNACVYIAVFILINQNSALLSLLVYVVATAIIDHYTDHFESIKMVTIITQEPDTLVTRIKNEMNKTCTIMDSFGAIAGNNKTLICYVNYFELQKLRGIIKSTAKKAFVTILTIDEII